MSKVRPFSFPFYSSPGEKEARRGCEKFVFTAIWQKVLREQALTLSFQTHWEAALALIKVFLLMAMWFSHNKTLCYFPTHIPHKCFAIFFFASLAF